MSSIDQSEIIIASTQGYNEEEKQFIAKIIADISLVFWIKNKNELSKIQISPEIDWKSTSKYKDIGNEWQQKMENGWTSFIPGGAIISKSIQIFGKTTRIGERSCITKTSFSTNSTMTADNIYLPNIGETTISEKCRIGNRQIASEAKIKGDTQINLPLECSISSEKLKCGRIKYLFENEEINQARIRRVSVIQNPESKEESNYNTEYIIGAIIGSICFIIITIVTAKKFKTSTPRNSRSQSPNSAEEIEMDEMGPYKCLRRQNESSNDRENYSIFNSYNSLDGSWRLDRKNGGNRSLNETDIRRAMIDSRFHQDEESAKGCCYNSSELPTADSSQESTTKNVYGPEPYIDLFENGDIIIPQSKLFPNQNTTPDSQDPTTSLDASWHLDRSDGTNRSLNISEIEEKRPTAPEPVYPPLPFNPFFEHSPPPFPINTPPAWNNDTPTLGELMEIERREEMEAGATYNHEL